MAAHHLICTPLMPHYIRKSFLCILLLTLRPCGGIQQRWMARKMPLPTLSRLALSRGATLTDKVKCDHLRNWEHHPSYSYTVGASHKISLIMSRIPTLQIGQILKTCSPTLHVHAHRPVSGDRAAGTVTRGGFLHLARHGSPRLFVATPKTSLATEAVALSSGCSILS